MFGELEWRETTAPSPSTKGLSKQTSAMLERTTPALRDQVTVWCALGNEHNEISACQALIALAHSLGLSDPADLFAANLAQEVRASEELAQTLVRILA